MAWLDDNPPNHQQFRCPRRERPSGIIGVHTAESFPDESGPDTGAESVADFIRRRTSYGSYHLLADSDSIIQLVRFGCVAYHIATHGLNEHTIGISAATQAHKWNSLDSDYADAMVRNLARAAARAARWLQREYGITVPARRISLAQALRGERGFLAHGDADPDRRTDPGATFPWNDFLGYYADEMSGDDMSWSDKLRSFVRLDGDETAENAVAKTRRDTFVTQRILRYSGSSNQSNKFAREAGVRVIDNPLHPGSEENPEYDKPAKEQRRASLRFAIERIWKNCWWTLVRVRRIEAKLDGFISSQDERVQDAVAAALAEHDKRVVNVDISVEDSADEEADA